MVGAGETHAQDGPGRRSSRLCVAGCGWLASGWRRLCHNQDRLGGGEKKGLLGPAGEEPDLGIGLPAVGFKRQRQPAVGLGDVRARFRGPGRAAPGDGRERTPCRVEDPTNGQSRRQQEREAFPSHSHSSYSCSYAAPKIASLEEVTVEALVALKRRAEP